MKELWLLQFRRKSCTCFGNETREESGDSHRRRATPVPGAGRLSEAAGDASAFFLLSSLRSPEPPFLLSSSIPETRASSLRRLKLPPSSPTIKLTSPSSPFCLIFSSNPRGSLTLCSTISATNPTALPLLLRRQSSPPPLCPGKPMSSSPALSHRKSRASRRNLPSDEIQKLATRLLN